ncbi:hypothetical protein FHR81_003884 [Actinoalloteichus hoggarensis]|uniref:Uncharacterized protein n=1 Tax=Actinoalloteichus hoggarensis TaxID=1470176 RepID=A0A221VVX7_9PSEU|nr:hypothetical protein [Actinoalloteichus hoggarensis]ASO17702.1 hypothetical protein AHOG_00125 [Actinoalloteichus hoggarensis]MBB5922827.1 hypothetical protein [Actinoalloteichus hoggarensis]
MTAEVPSSEETLPDVLCRDAQGRLCRVAVRVVEDRIELSSPETDVLVLDPDSVQTLAIALRGAVARLQARIRARAVPLPRPRGHAPRTG